MPQDGFEIFNTYKKKAETLSEAVSSVTNPVGSILDSQGKNRNLPEDPRTKDFPSFFPAAIPGAGPVMIEDGKVKPITDEPYLTDEPALTTDPSEVKVTYTKPFLGSSSIQDRIRPIIRGKEGELTPIIAVRATGKDGAFIPSETAPDVIRGDTAAEPLYLDIPADVVNRASSMINKDGVKENFNEDDTLERRLNAINAFKATKLGMSRGNLTQELDIPFERITEDFTKYTKDMERYVQKIPFISKQNEYSTMLNSGIDANTNRAIYANKLVKKLKAYGIKDERTIAGIVAHKTGLPQFGGIGFGDPSKLVGSVRNAARFTFEALPYLAGEAYDAITDDIETQAEGFDLRKTEDRGAFFDRFLPNHAAAIQDRYAQLNIDVSYPVAERIARDFSGIATKAIGIGAEVKGGTAPAVLLTRIGGTKEAKLFQDYSMKLRKKYGDDGISEEDIVQKFLDHRRQQLFGFNIGPATQVVFDTRLVGVPAKLIAKPFSFINGIRTSSRFKAGMELEEAALSLTNRPEVKNMARYRRQLYKQRDAILSRVKRDNRAMSSVETDQIAKLNRKLKISKRDLRVVIAESEMPRFIKETKVIDGYVILGATAASHAFELYGGDPLLGEFFGGLAGIGYGIARNVNEAKALMLKFDFIADKAPIMSADLILRNMAHLSPEFQATMRQRIEYFNGLKQELIKLGVSPITIESSATRVMGLSILQAIEEGQRIELNAPQVANFQGNMEDITKNLRIQEQYAADIRRAMREIATVQGVPEEGTSIAKFYDILDSTLQLAESSIKQLDADISTLNTNYEKSILGLIEDSGDGMTHLGDDAVTSLDIAFEHLAEQGIQKIDQSKVDEIKAAANVASDKILESTTKKANQISRRLPTQQQTNQTVDTVLPDGKIIRPGVKPVKTSAIETAGDALAVVLESVHVEERNIASAKFRKLDNSEFFTPDGQPINGVPITDAGTVLDGVFDALGTKEGIDLLLELQGTTLRRSEASKLFGVLDDFAGGFLADVTEKSSEYDDIAVLISDAVEAAKTSSDPALRKIANDPRLKNNQNLIAVYSIRSDLMKSSELSVDALPMTFNQAKRLSDAISLLKFKATTDEAKLRISELSSIADATLDNFNVKTPDGLLVPVDNLMIQRDDLPVLPDGEMQLSSVSDYLRLAKDEWQEYKVRFHEEDKIRKWMGWADKNARSATGPSSDNPLGFTHGSSKPSTWLNFNSISDDGVTGRREINRVMSRTFGQIQPDGSYAIIQDSVKGRAVTAVLEAHLREWMIDTVKSGKPIDYTDMLRRAKALDETFIGLRSSPDVNGNRQVSLLDSEKVFRDVFPEYSSTTLSKSDYDRGQNQLQNAISSEKTRVVKEAETVKDGIAKSKRFLDRFESTDLDSSSAASKLLEGGVSRLNKVKVHLKELGNNEEEVNKIIKGILVDEIENKAFKLTSSTSVDPQNPNRLIPDAELDLEKLKDIIGINSPTVRQAVSEILGPEYFKKYKTLVEFIEARKLEAVRGVNMKGIPRSFSIESYISRFYAINRGVVSFRYVGTEAVLQSMRRRNMSLISAALTDPKVGDALLEMIATGKPLPAQKEKQFFLSLVRFAERYENYRESKKQPFEVVSEYGHSIKYNINTEMRSIVYP